MANKTVDSDLQVNGKVAAGGGESKIEMGYAAEYDEFFLRVPEGGKTLSIGNDAWDDRINLNGSPYAGEYRFDDPELVMSATSGRNDGIEFLVHGSTQRPLIGAGGLYCGAQLLDRHMHCSSPYSNAFFEASLLSCCADNLLFTDAKHTDAVFHR